MNETLFHDNQFLAGELADIVHRDLDTIRDMSLRWAGFVHILHSHRPEGLSDLTKIELNITLTHAEDMLKSLRDSGLLLRAVAEGAWRTDDAQKQKIEGEDSSQMEFKEVEVKEQKEESAIEQAFEKPTLENVEAAKKELEEDMREFLGDEAAEDLLKELEGKSG